MKYVAFGAIDEEMFYKEADDRNDFNDFIKELDWFLIVEKENDCWID